MQNTSPEELVVLIVEIDEKARQTTPKFRYCTTSVSCITCKSIGEQLIGTKI